MAREARTPPEWTFGGTWDRSEFWSEPSRSVEEEFDFPTPRRKTAKPKAAKTTLRTEVAAPLPVVRVDLSGEPLL